MDEEIDDTEIVEIARLANMINAERADIRTLKEEISQIAVVLDAKGRSLDTLQTGIFKQLNSLREKLYGS